MEIRAFTYSFTLVSVLKLKFNAGNIYQKVAFLCPFLSVFIPIVIFSSLGGILYKIMLRKFKAEVGDVCIDGLIFFFCEGAEGYVHNFRNLFCTPS